MTNPLDQWLPLLEADGVVVDACLVEVADAAQLVELARNPRIGRYLLGRLSDTAALVDPGHEDDLLKALRTAGHTPKTAQGALR
jgi:hypothetical protein